MSEEAELRRKIRRAVQLLLLQRPRSPGVKGWELRKTLGREYIQLMDVVNEELGRLELEVKSVGEEGEPIEDYDKARFYVIMKQPPPTSELVSGGWRVDDLAILAATLGYLLSRHGKAPRRDVEKLLKEKFPRWKVDLDLDRYIRRGYLAQIESETLVVGWRTRAEIDQKTLMNILLSSSSSQEPVTK